MAYKEISIEKQELFLAVLHSAVIGIVLTLIYLTDTFEMLPVDWLVYPLVAFFIVVMTVPLYLKTGIPNVVQHRCENCGEHMNSGKVRCDSCGNIIAPDFGIQLLWFLIGYGSLISLFGLAFVLSRSLLFGFGMVYTIGYALLTFFVCYFSRVFYIFVHAKYG